MADLPKVVGSWPVIRELGEGGQGSVYLVRSPERHELRQAALQTLWSRLRAASAMAVDESARSVLPVQIADALALYIREDAPHELGAGKTYHIPPGPFAEKTVQRLHVEFQVLTTFKHLHVMNALHTDLASRLMISEYYPGGSLAGVGARFQGRAIESLEALRGIVHAVAELHERNVVHRDVKPVNIFIAADGRLVLGDFGIVFVEANNPDRLTETFERVGSRDWMAPWALTGMRVDAVRPNFDVFALGKVLWSMLSGQPMLPYWYWNRPSYDLTVQFPRSPEMQIINERILAVTVVEDEERCLDRGRDLLTVLDEVLDGLKYGARAISNDAMRCLVCQRATYQLMWPDHPLRLASVPEVPAPHFAPNASTIFYEGRYLTVRVYRCSNCGHVAMFQFPDNEALPAWKGK